MNKRLHHCQNRTQDVHELRIENLCVSKPAWVLSMCLICARKPSTCERRQSFCISVNQCHCHARSQDQGKISGVLTNGWSLLTPLGATFSSSSLPKILLRPPGFGSPNSFAKTGPDRIDLKFDESEVIFCLKRLDQAHSKTHAISHLSIANSSLPGHHVPAAMKLPPPGETIFFSEGVPGQVRYGRTRSANDK